MLAGGEGGGILEQQAHPPRQRPISHENERTNRRLQILGLISSFGARGPGELLTVLPLS